LGKEEGRREMGRCMYWVGSLALLLLLSLVVEGATIWRPFMLAQPTAASISQAGGGGEGEGGGVVGGAKARLEENRKARRRRTGNGQW
jgi:hypothetical protein